MLLPDCTPDELLAEIKRIDPAVSVLIRDAAGAVIGAVGISGDMSANDEKCGIAGIEAAGLKADPGKHPT